MGYAIPLHYPEQNMGSQIYYFFSEKCPIWHPNGVTLKIYHSAKKLSRLYFENRFSPFGCAFLHESYYKYSSMNLTITSTVKALPKRCPFQTTVCKNSSATKPSQYVGTYCFSTRCYSQSKAKGVILKRYHSEINTKNVGNYLGDTGLSNAKSVILKR